MRLLLTITLLFTTITCFAQEQVIYYKNNLERVKLKDSADFIRVIRMPDAGKDLYKVTDYYKNGKIKLNGESSLPDVAVFQGEQITYSENGDKTTVSNYNNGKLVGFISEFFPNGKLYLVKDLRKTPSSDDDIMANYDSLGNQLVTNGNGYAKLYAEDFKTVIAEGAEKREKETGCGGLMIKMKRG